MSFYIAITPQWLTFPAMIVFIVGLIIVSALIVAGSAGLALALYWRAARGKAKNK